MKCKFSDYNVTVKDESNFILFNTRTLAMAEIDENYYSLFSSKNLYAFEELPKEEQMALIENGFLLPVAIDEINMLKSDYWENKFNNPTLHISIMTTLDCNFKCFYCFEKKRKEYLNVDVEDLIFEFISQQISDFQNLQIDWYGGEPLLNIDSIKRLSERLIKLCEENNVSYNASITTNGYNIDLISEEELSLYKIRSMQVTIDGIRIVHDKRRILLNGAGTYDKIIQNILNRPTILFDIRVNVDKDSYQYAKELFDELKRYELHNINISVKGIVSSDNNPCYEKEIEETDLSKITLELYAYLRKLGIPSAFSDCFNVLTREYCVVDTNTQYIISPEGDVFKCGESFDNTDPGKIGTLTCEGIQLNRNIYNWVKDPFSYTECIKCRILPLCMGGCQLIRNVKKACACHSEYKYGLEELIVYFFHQQFTNTQAQGET